MNKSLLVLITLISLNSFGQASSQMNNLLNVDSGINPPNIVYTLPAPNNNERYVSRTSKK